MLALCATLLLSATSGAAPTVVLLSRVTAVPQSTAVSYADAMTRRLGPAARVGDAAEQFKALECNGVRSCLAAVGKAGHAEDVVTLELAKLEDDFGVHLELLDVESAKTVYQADALGKAKEAEKTLTGMVPPLMPHLPLPAAPDTPSNVVLTPTQTTEPRQETTRATDVATGLAEEPSSPRVLPWVFGGGGVLGGLVAGGLALKARSDQRVYEGWQPRPGVFTVSEAQAEAQRGRVNGEYTAALVSLAVGAALGVCAGVSAASE